MSYVVSKITNLVSNLSHSLINLRLVLEEGRTDDTAVDHVGAIPGQRQEAPYQEHALSKPIEWEP